MKNDTTFPPAKPKDYTFSLAIYKITARINFISHIKYPNQRTVFFLPNSIPNVISFAD